MEELCQHHSGLQADIANLQRNNKRIERKTDDVCKKLDGIRNWIMGLAGVMITSLILLVIQMANGG